MSLPIEGVMKAIGAARMARNAAGLDTPVLDELYDGLSGAPTPGWNECTTSPRTSALARQCSRRTKAIPALVIQPTPTTGFSPTPFSGSPSGSLTFSSRRPVGCATAGKLSKTLRNR